jgi:hypothetical protein
MEIKLATGTCLQKSKVACRANPHHGPYSRPW